jgi:hypothetical protein
MPMLSVRLAAAPLVCLLFVLLAAGCGGSRRSAPVTGKVTANGQPLAQVVVTFEPVGGGVGQGSSGTTDASGSYTLRFIDNDQTGAVIGKHQVTVHDLQASAEGADGGAMPKQKFRFPQKYLTEPLMFDVMSGGNQADFDLK